MILLRSLLFAVLFYLNNLAWFVIGLPTLLLPYDMVLRTTLVGWTRTNLWIHRVVCGVTLEVRGRENIRPGALLVAAKHQSAWETIYLASVFRRPVYVLKRELMWVPLFGWYLKRLHQIPIDRSRGGALMSALNERARQAIASGRQLLIFPEGTRRPVGAKPAYRSGVSHLYTELGVACLPVAHNAGVVWPRRTFLKYPGRIIVEFLPPIEPGLPRDVFMPRLQAVIEEASDRLAAEGGRA